ncbi:ATP-binding protein [Nitrincola tapanii]|uniref:histidine kinase n=1 Tax=Nitrincola tapanii TaxID=1708751 RepID=A0A5A9VZC5_9GAMM|nr:ATP-binding protein [Nitrincola tapanii]KAA0873662.1 PAS domain S-box protein [Nitrincola tapanii]
MISDLRLPLLLLIGVAYLLLLLACAYAAERGWIAQRWVRHPLVHTLSLGIYASAWTFYGAFSIARDSGFTYLISYLGASAAFMLSPLILLPILRLTRTYQLSSLADLFAFRFHSAAIGSLTTALVMLASLPLIVIQIQGIVSSIRLFNDTLSEAQLALAFCLLLTLFSILFGARHPSLRSRHDGLSLAIAIKSLVKVVVLLTLASYVFLQVFNGQKGLNLWLTEHPAALETLLSSPDNSSWRTLFIAFFGAAFLTPHMFHILFSENASESSLRLASWLMPLFLLLMALAIPPLLWTGFKLELLGNPDYLLLALGQALSLDWFIILAFIGVLSAASGVILVANIALASMLQNHLLLPVIRLPDSSSFYRWLLWLRRSLILVVMSVSYAIYLLLDQRFSLAQLGLITFMAFLQFLPGLFATLYWQGASRVGFLAGLSGGLSIWLMTVIQIYLSLEQPSHSLDLWYEYTLLSLLLNTLLLIGGSLLFPADAREAEHATACILNALPRQTRLLGHDKDSLENLEQRLSQRLGQHSARREIEQARQILDLPNTNKLGPLDLLKLRNTLENNLSGLLGPVEATALLRPESLQQARFRGREIHLLEEQLEHYDERLSGLAAELDKIRRFHRFTLQRLPIGVLTLDDHSQILFWNRQLQEYTGIDANEAIGSDLPSLPSPWAEFFGHFTQSPEKLHETCPLEHQHQTRWFSLHKTLVNEGNTQGMIVLIEDETEHRQIANRLAHSERLTSIGRFAAGVAHEIGNPVTGIACLAQNLKLETDDPIILETGSHILTQTQRISRIVQSLVRFAHTGQADQLSKLEAVNLYACAQEAVELLRFDERGRNMLIMNQIPPEYRCSGDPQLLLQVFVNLLNNACDASPEHSRIVIDASQMQNALRVRITDPGSGIEPEHQQRLFEPFFTTKEPGKGTGLGLALVYNIITEHCGNIEFISPADKKQNKGTQVIIQLPLWVDSALSTQTEKT